jgi:hypothetical protein
LENYLGFESTWQNSDFHMETFTWNCSGREILAERHINVSTSCPLCHAGPQDTRHLSFSRLALQQDPPFQQRIDALPNVHISVGKVYTNGLVCVAVGGVARLYNNTKTCVGNWRA